MRERLLVGLMAIACAVVSFSGTAFAQDKRFALLIGNQAYDASVGALKNPHNDIELVAKALEKQGFEVLPTVKDARRSVILGAVRELTRRLTVAGPGAVGFFYYSGHGAAEKDTGINYLIPVDAHDPGTTTFWDESVKLDDIMRLLDGARGAVKFVVFDACRNELQLPTRDTSKGLVPVAEQQGFFIAYASAPGRTASDRGATSGPYAAALAHELERKGLDHLNLFQNVKETVIASTGGSQQPWESNGLSRRVFLTGEASTPADLALWESVRSSNDSGALQRYLDKFPSGVFAATALEMVERLKATQLLEAERKAQEARQAEEMRKVLDEIRKAREALALAYQQQSAREATAAAARDAATAAQSQRDAAAAREAEARSQAQAVPDKKAPDPEQSRKLAEAVEDARKARDALAAAERDKAAAEAEAAAARQQAEAATQTREEVARVAALTPGLPARAQEPDVSPEQLARQLQTELKRVGCYTGDIDGDFGSGSRRAIGNFTQSTGIRLPAESASPEALAAVSAKRGRICKLECSDGEVEQGGRCVQKAVTPKIQDKPEASEPQKRSTVSAKSAPEPKKSRPDAFVFARSIWPPNTLKKGQTVTSNTPYGRISCTSLGVGQRICSWY